MFHFPDRASWLVLALETRFCRVAGTIAGTAIFLLAFAKHCRPDSSEEQFHG